MIATAITKPLIAPDATLPQRDTLLSESLMAPRLAKGIHGFSLASVDDCRLERVKYRFGKSIRVLFKVRLGGESVMVAARTFDAARFVEMQAKKKAQSADTVKLLPDFFDEEIQAAFWVFPNDRKISNLGILTKIPDYLAQVPGRPWKRSRMTAYAPEKCATAQCLDESGETIAYAKVFAGNDVSRIHSIYKNLSGAQIRFPRALAYFDVQRTLILEAIHGTRVADLKIENNDVYRQFGVAVAMFHQTEPIKELLPSKRIDSAGLSSALQTIAKARPDHAFQAAKLCEKLSALSFDSGPDVCLHGDLHAKNAIWNNGELTLIDLDQVSVGEAATDIGSFLAALQYKECIGQLAEKHRIAISNELLNGYASVRPLPSERSLRRHTAAALFAERALRAVTRYRVEGLENMGPILTEAESILSGGQL